MARSAYSECPECGAALPAEEFWHRAPKRKTVLLIDPRVALHCPVCAAALLPNQSRAVLVLPVTLALIIVVGKVAQRFGVDFGDIRLGVLLLLPLGVVVAVSFKLYPRLINFQKADAVGNLRFPLDERDDGERGELGDSSPELWPCVHCGDASPSTFETCWRCGKPRVPSNKSLERSRDR